MRRILNSFFPSRRLRRMADKARRRIRVSYAIAAGYFPRAYLSRNVRGIDILPSGMSGAGKVRIQNSGSVRVYDSPPGMPYNSVSIPARLSAYRLSSLPSLCRDA